MTTQPGGRHEDDLAPASAGPRDVPCAVLACPPTTSGARTRGALAPAADVLGYRTVIIANLLSVPAADTQAMNAPGAFSDAWLGSRDALAAALRDGDGVLAAWGVGPLKGPARLHRYD